MVKIWEEARGVFVDGIIQVYPDEVRRLPWYKGQSFKGKIPEGMVITCNRIVGARRPPDYFPHADLFVVADKLRKILEYEGANVEFFQVFVQHQKNLFDNYVIVNPLEVVDCLDPAKTVYSEEGLISHAIKRIALRLDRVEGKPLFRIAGETLVGVSDHLAAEVQNGHCTGVRFESPEEWRNPVIPSDYPPGWTAGRKGLG